MINDALHFRETFLLGLFEKLLKRVRMEPCCRFSLKGEGRKLIGRFGRGEIP